MEDINKIMNPILTKEEQLFFYYEQYEKENNKEKKIIILKRIEELKMEIENGKR